MVSPLTALPSFPFYFLRDAFFTLHLSGTAHKLRTAFARLPNQNFAARRNDFFDFRQICKKRLVAGHLDLSLIQPPSHCKGMSSGIARTAASGQRIKNKEDNANAKPNRASRRDAHKDFG
jgi:hypothetical protein